MAGDAGGRRLVVPKGDLTRPTSDRVREGLFNALDARGLIPGATVLDLYCGSGALGLEAISRGAASAVLVDSSREAVDAARVNVAALGFPRVAVVLSTVPRYLSRKPTQVSSLVFADPPYAVGQDDVTTMLALLITGGWLQPEATVLVERSSRSPEPSWPDGWSGKRSGATARPRSGRRNGWPEPPRP